MYKKGDLLPENFTHHDKARSIYNSRIAVCEVPDVIDEVKDTSAETPKNTTSESAPSDNASEKGTQTADKPQFNFSKPLTGTPSK
jgi:hypothetical protein